MRQYVRVVAVALILVLAIPSAGWSDPPDENVYVYLHGEFDVSLAAGRFTAHGESISGRFGRTEWDIDLSLVEVTSQPLCRDAFGTFTITRRSGHRLVTSVIDRLCYDPNSGLIYQADFPSRLKVVDGTGPFEGVTGDGNWYILGLVDDSGTHGTFLVDSIANIHFDR